MRQRLKDHGYKSGRISELFKKTRPAALASNPANFEEELITELEARQDSSAANVTREVVGNPGEQPVEWWEVLEEAAADEDNAEEVRGQPQILQPQNLHLARLRGKQAPRPDWDQMPISRCIAQTLVKLMAEEERAPALAETEDEDVEDEVEAAEPPMKKPARGVRPNEKCKGRGGDAGPCIFSPQQGRMGQPAMVEHGKTQCRFCDEDTLAGSLASPQKKKWIARALNIWKAAGREDIVDAALALLPDDSQASFRLALQRPSRAVAALEARAAEQVTGFRV